MNQWNVKIINQKCPHRLSLISGLQDTIRWCSTGDKEPIECKKENCPFIIKED